MAFVFIMNILFMLCKLPCPSTEYQIRDCYEINVWRLDNIWGHDVSGHMLSLWKLRSLLSDLNATVNEKCPVSRTALSSPSCVIILFDRTTSNINWTVEICFLSFLNSFVWVCNVTKSNLPAVMVFSTYLFCSFRLVPSHRLTVQLHYL